MADFARQSVSVAQQCLRGTLFILAISYTQCLTLNTACIEVKKAYAEKGFDENEVPITAISGADLSICPHTETCCTRSMEDKLISLSNKEHTRQLDESFKLLKSNFASRTKKFDEFFTDLLDNARKDLHEMFVKTYGLLYQQNAQIFTQLFDGLRGYYKGKDKNLVEVMENFFSTLLQRMFELINATYQFDDDYLVCVTERMNDLKPFGDVPQKLSLHVKRSFIAARTFVQGLAIGRDVVSTVMEIVPSDACLKAIVRMTYCPHCRGLTSTKPCSNYCLNTMKGCLAQHADLNEVWNAYIDALNMLAGRLEGPFNIESVVDPLDVKISEAIMNLQENSQKVTTQIFSGCGQPRLSRKRRETEEETDSQKYTFDFPKTSNARPTTASGTSLDRLVRDIKEKVKTAKDFWIRLPYAICNDEKVAAEASRDDDCWNGQDRARYVPEVQKDGVLHQINNPEVEVDVSKVNSIVNRQKLQLQLITHKLQNAYKGDDVDWIDTEIEGMTSGSGSGSFVDGSGSGAGVITEEEKAGFLDIDENPLHGAGRAGRKGSGHDQEKAPVGQPQTPTDKDMKKDDQGSKSTGDSGQGSEDRGRGKGEERKDERRRGGGRGSAVCLSESVVTLVLTVSMCFGLRRLLWSC